MGGTERKTRISVFGPTDHTFSIDRYARELTRGFPSTVDAKLIEYSASDALLRKQIDRFWGYPRFVERQKGDFNVIVTEAYAYLLRVLPGRNTICVCHDMHGLTYTGPRNAQYHFYYLRYRWALRFLNQAKFIVTISHNTKAELLKYCPTLSEERVIPVHNGLEDHWRETVPAMEREHLRVKYGLKNKRIILHVGSDLWYKNTVGLIQAFARLPDEDLHLVHVGNLMPNTLAVANNLKISRRIIKLTNLSDDELAALYQISEVLVFPSFTEGFGWPPLEAMACGCPTICSTAGSLREICGEASLFVDPHDISAMTNAISRVLNDEVLRDSLIAKGHAQAARFSWGSTANKFLELFETN